MDGKKEKKEQKNGSLRIFHKQSVEKIGNG
jgi:hypothetical protein